MAKKYLLTNENTKAATSGTSNVIANYVTLNNTEYTMPGASATKQAVYNMFYPVGSFVVGFNEPSVPSGVTATWLLTTEHTDVALWNDSALDTGTGLPGSLPTVTGSIGEKHFIDNTPTLLDADGCFTESTGTWNTWGHNYNTGTGYKYNKITISAHSKNSIYAAEDVTNTLVRPTSVVIHCWKRTA